MPQKKRLFKQYIMILLATTLFYVGTLGFYTNEVDAATVYLSCFNGTADYKASSTSGSYELNLYKMEKNNKNKLIQGSKGQASGGYTASFTRNNLKKGNYLVAYHKRSGKYEYAYATCKL